MFSSKATLPSQGGQFMGSIKRVFSSLTSVRKLHSKLNDVRDRIACISSESGLIHVLNHERGAVASSETYEQLNSIGCRLPALLVPEPNFVGHGDELEKLMEQLTGGEQQLCVVSVYGLPGLGKTTLAKKAYNNHAVKSHFNTRAWVCMAEEYSVEVLLLKAIAECGVEQHSLLLSPKEKLKEYLLKILGNKRYLIVLDDIKEPKLWDDLNDAFPKADNGSRILLTTSSRGMAKLAESTLHQLQFLRRCESWQMFHKKSFSREYDCLSSDLEGVGRRILSKCVGVPLAVVIIRGLLSRKDPQEWERVTKSIEWQRDEKGQLSHLLSLSWKDLPYYLRPCLVYMSNFPEDYEFRAKKLIQLWEAEEIVHSTGDKTEEQVREEFLMELVQRGMVQIARKTLTSGIKTCSTHTLICKLCASKAAAGFSSFNQSDSLNLHRLAFFNCSSNSFSSKLETATFLRTFLWLNWIPHVPEKLPFSFFKLKQLRVLDLEGTAISELPNDMDQLVHLRYLGLRQTSLQKLPPSADNLRNLQTLDVKHTHVHQIPAAIQGMKRLRHLHVNDDIQVENSELIGSLEDIQTISMMHTHAWMKNGLSKLAKLRKLGIKGDFSYCRKGLSSLSNLESLRVVLHFGNETLDWASLPQNLAKLHLVRRLEKLPQAGELPKNLVKLCLRWSLLEEDQFLVLQSFQNLRMLLLGRCSYIGKSMVFEAGGLSKLQVLRIDQLNELEEISIKEGALPHLGSLAIRFCRRLKELPQGLQHASKLELLETELMT